MDHKVEHRIDAFETLVLEKTLEIPLDCREIKPVNVKRNFYAYLLTYTYMLVPNYLRVGSMYHRASQVALVVKNLPASAEDMRPRIDQWIRKIPWRHDSPPQYPCLENPKDRGAWGTTVHRVSMSLAGLTRLSTQTPGIACLTFLQSLRLRCIFLQEKDILLYYTVQSIQSNLTS